MTTHFKDNRRTPAHWRARDAFEEEHDWLASSRLEVKTRHVTVTATGGASMALAAGTGAILGFWAITEANRAAERSRQAAADAAQLVAELRRLSPQQEHSTAHAAPPRAIQHESAPVSAEGPQGRAFRPGVAHDHRRTRDDILEQTRAEVRAFEAWVRNQSVQRRTGNTPRLVQDDHEASKDQA